MLKCINKAKQRVIQSTKFSVYEVIFAERMILGIISTFGLNLIIIKFFKNLQSLAKSETVDKLSLNPATIVTQFFFCVGYRETVAARSASFAPLYE